MKEKLIEKIKAQFKKLDPDKEWHQISQKDANEMKNFNKGLQKAIEIVEEEL